MVLVYTLAVGTSGTNGFTRVSMELSVVLQSSFLSISATAVRVFSPVLVVVACFDFVDSSVGELVTGSAMESGDKLSGLACSSFVSSDKEGFLEGVGGEGGDVIS